VGATLKKELYMGSTKENSLCKVLKSIKKNWQMFKNIKEINNKIK
jgi:hypothetical protein